MVARRLTCLIFKPILSTTQLDVCAAIFIRVVFLLIVLYETN